MTDWHQRAACRGTDPGLWLPAVGDLRTIDKVLRPICAGCDVRPECREDALSHAKLDGFRGGTTVRERRRLRLERRWMQEVVAVRRV